MRAGDRVEITDRPPYYIHLDHWWDRNTKLYLRVVGCRGTVRQSYVTWDGVPYVELDMDLDLEGGPYTIGREECLVLSAVDRLGELA